MPDGKASETKGLSQETKKSIGLYLISSSLDTYFEWLYSNEYHE